MTINKISVTVPTALDIDNITLAGTQAWIAPKAETLLFISDVNNLVQDAEAILSVTDGVNVLPLESPRGYNIRADQLVQRAMRMPGGLVDNSTMVIKVRVATDPARVISFTPLRRSAANRPATTAGTATGTGINLD